MKSSTLILLSVLPSTCFGTNNSFTWDSASRTPATSSTRLDIAHYIAAGLGISTRETSSYPTTNTNAEDNAAIGLDPSTGGTSSTSVVLTSDDRALSSDLKSLSQTRYNGTAFLTTASSSGAASLTVHMSTNATNITSTTDCWRSWLSYWSASSLNTVSYLTTGSSFNVDVHTETDIAYSSRETSWFESKVSTVTTSVLQTVSRDGYPVSVSVTYSTYTDSKVGWVKDTDISSLGEYNGTITYTDGYVDPTIITLPATSLPTPTCQLLSIMPECSARWSSFFDRASDYIEHGDIAPTPDCTQVLITDDWCTTLRSLHLAPETYYGQTRNVGWINTNGTADFPAAQSLAPGCTLGCQACSITGQSVQLYYWPPSTSLAVGNITKAVSKIRTVSIDGECATLLTENYAMANFYRHGTHITDHLYLL